MKLVKLRCVECEQEFRLNEEVELAEIVICPVCNTEYEVVGVESGSVNIRLLKSDSKNFGEQM